MPLSSNPERRQRQLANLRRGRPPAPSLPSERSALAIRLEQLPTSPTVRKTVAAIERLLAGEDLSHIGPADAPTVTLLAVAWHAIQLCLKDIAQHGPFKPNGEARESVRLLDRFIAAGLKAADALGLSPQARARLGLAAARTTAAEELLLRLAESAPTPPTAAEMTKKGGGEDAV